MVLTRGAAVDSLTAHPRTIPVVDRRSGATVDVQQVVADYLAGKDVSGRRIVVPPPRFFSIAEAKAIVGAPQLTR